MAETFLPSIAGYRLDAAGMLGVGVGAESEPPPLPGGSEGGPHPPHAPATGAPRCQVGPTPQTRQCAPRHCLLVKSSGLGLHASVSFFYWLAAEKSIAGATPPSPSVLSLPLPSPSLSHPITLSNAQQNAGAHVQFNVKDVLQEIASTGAVSEDAAAQALVVMSRGGQWDLDEFVGAFDGVSWPLVLSLLDRPGFAVGGVEGLETIVGAYRRGCGGAWPADALLRQWHNSAGQLSILRACLESPPEMSVVLLVSAGQDEAELRELAGGKVCVWSSHDVVASLLRLSEREGCGAVRPFFEMARCEGPGVLLAGMAQVHAEFIHPLRTLAPLLSKAFS